MKETGTAKTRSNLFHRASAGVNLAKFFLYSLDIEGARAECGVFRGASALLLSRIARIKRPDFAGADYFLIDSFEGFGEENEHDKVLWQGDDSNTEFRTAFPAGGIGTSLETLQHTLREFPGVTIHKGWIPEVFAKLPETRWSFVYLDVDIYEPTLAGLEYFYPRMSPGGVIITDDFGHPMTPGVRKAWEQYCVANEVPYIVLDNLQAVILRQ